jgi:hypothetical protein
MTRALDITLRFERYPDGFDGCTEDEVGTYMDRYSEIVADAVQAEYPDANIAIMFVDEGGHAKNDVNLIDDDLSEDDEWREWDEITDRVKELESAAWDAGAWAEAEPNTPVSG